MRDTRQQQHLALLLATFVIAICGLVYELLTGTLSSYLLGDSIYQFSLVIGLFMSSMGIGSWLSRFIDRELPTGFVRLQLLIALLGGFTAPCCFSPLRCGHIPPACAAAGDSCRGAVGVEITSVIRITQEHASLKINLSNVFTADYIGALMAALLFPLNCWSRSWVCCKPVSCSVCLMPLSFRGLRFATGAIPGS
ncbi:MAG: hypothetical protein R3E95_18130 [Thiolinea sp.]